MLETNRRVAEALRIPATVLNLWIYVGTVPLVVGGMARISWLGYVDVVVALGFFVAGVRAALSPSQPFTLGPGTVRFLGTTRRIGLFYILVGVVWVLLSVSIIRS